VQEMHEGKKGIEGKQGRHRGCNPNLQIMRITRGEFRRESQRKKLVTGLVREPKNLSRAQRS
jgi:hypothetical protein